MESALKTVHGNTPKKLEEEQASIEAPKQLAIEAPKILV